MFKENMESIRLDLLILFYILNEILNVSNKSSKSNKSTPIRTSSSNLLDNLIKNYLNIVNIYMDKNDTRIVNTTQLNEEFNDSNNLIYREKTDNYYEEIATELGIRIPDVINKFIMIEN